MTDFQREERYIVIKRKEITPAQEAMLRGFLTGSQINTTVCVVVEADWPIYDQVWEMIEQTSKERK